MEEASLELSSKRDQDKFSEQMVKSTRQENIHLNQVKNNLRVKFAELNNQKIECLETEKTSLCNYIEEINEKLKSALLEVNQFY